MYIYICKKRERETLIVIRGTYSLVQSLNTWDCCSLRQRPAVVVVLFSSSFGHVTPTCFVAFCHFLHSPFVRGSQMYVAVVDLIHHREMEYSAKVGREYCLEGSIPVC